ncbi:Chondroitinase-AC [Drechslerella dactyloides]|uniref:Chondroitinase-AC n=1 Tax=Drechslerella dactyloides TaxID=74499 RepID=A0AAD6IZF6_DREDA|nr:Chondroitinase-AC [Drechslerella dactyloides]
MGFMAPTFPAVRSLTSNQRLLISSALVLVVAVLIVMFGKLGSLRDKAQGLSEHVQKHLHLNDHPGQEHQQQPQQHIINDGSGPQCAGDPPPPVPQRPASQEAFANLRRKWFAQVVGDFDTIDQSDPNVRTNVEAISDGGRRVLRDIQLRWDRVLKNVGPLRAGDIGFHTSYTRLLRLASAWATPGTAQYRDEEVLQRLLQGLDHIHKIFYNSGNQDIKDCIKSRNNWWAIQIGAPKTLADICVILYDQLGPDRRQQWGQTIVDFVGNTAIPSLKGGNRAWTARVLVITGIFMDNEDVLRRGIATLSAQGGGPEVSKNTLFQYVEAGAGEGLYKDGTLLSHDVYPYAGGYGLVMLDSVACLLALLNAPDSPDEFRVTDPNAGIIYEMVERNFLPVVWQGMIFEHVRGREVARRDGTGWKKGQALICAAALLSKGCGGNVSSDLESFVRLWHNSNPGATLNGCTLSQMPTLQSILRNRTGPVAAPPRGAFATPLQEHFAYHAPDSRWCFTLSLCSKRIGRAETLGVENIKSWYQGDGMTYLYTHTHKTHYDDDYWSTMDPLHVPGTTNHQVEPPPPRYKGMGYRDWSGGACWAGGGGGNGVAFRSGGAGARVAAVSMDHYAGDKRSAAKKSWFMMEHAIVALGAGCTGNSEPASNLHTTVESRNLDEPGRLLVINGEEYRNEPDWEKASNRVYWAWLENTAGYVFLDAGRDAPYKLFSRQRRCGKWSDVNEGEEKSDCHREYVNIIIDHGVNPKVSSYAYAILPLADVETTRLSSENPTWTLLQNTVEVQAIRNRFDNGNSDVLTATFWAPGGVDGVGVDQPCQLVWGSWSGGSSWCLTVSDPTHKVQRVAVSVPAIGQWGLRTANASEGVVSDGDRVIFDGLKDGAAKSIFFTGRGGHDEL